MLSHQKFGKSYLKMKPLNADAENEKRLVAVVKLLALLVALKTWIQPAS